MAEGPKTTGFHPGFVWGCLAPVVAIVLIVIGWFSYNTYYYTSGYKEAPGLPEVMLAVNANPTATKILGEKIQIERMELSMLGEKRKNGQRIFYKVLARGSKAEGQIQTSVLMVGRKVTINDLKLIDYDGIPHNLRP